MAGAVRLTSRRLVGRDEEFDAVLRVLTSLPDGRPALVLISGVAGIGKTRLTTTLLDRLRTERSRILSGSCVYPGSTPFAPLISAFRSADPPAVQVLDALTGAVEMRRSRLFELLRATLAGLARRGPTVVVVEDVHWSDRATRDALTYLCATARDGQWGLVVTYRDDEVADKPVLSDFIQVLARDTSAHVRLGPLPPDAVAGQIAGITGLPPTAKIAERMHRRSGGIPLLVEELVAADSSGLGGVPDHLRDLFLARVRSLGPPRQVVAVASVATRSVDERVVACVLGIDEPPAREALERAVAVGILDREQSRYRPRHDLLRQAVYESLPPGRRRELHASIARLIESTAHPDIIDLAHHWYFAGETAQAYAVNLKAAELAERLHSPPTARIHLERSIECWEALNPDVPRTDLLARTAAAAELEGSFEQAAKLTERVMGLANHSAERASCLERLMLSRWRGGDGHGAETAFSDALATLPNDAPSALRARVLAGCAWFQWVSFHPDKARRLADEALAAAADVTDEQIRCRVLLSWGITRSETDEGLTALRDARELAVKADASEELARAHIAIGLALNRRGRTIERADALQNGRREVSALGLARSFEAALDYQLVEVDLELGRWDEAHALLADMRERGVKGVPAMFASGEAAKLASLRGDAPGLAAALEETLAMARDIPQQQAAVVAALLARAEAAAWNGDYRAAQAAAVKASEMVTDPLLAAWVACVRARVDADVIEAAQRHGRTATAIEGNLFVLDDDPSPVVRACAETSGAEASRPRRDPRPWRAAVVAWDDLSNPYRAAYCRWRLAKALLASRSGRAEALQLLQTAWQTANSLGAAPLREAIEASARSARLPLDALSMADAGARMRLTARELEILPLLAAGRTNAEIADAFFISPRTVGVHVSNILRKLGAARRTEAADIARNNGLLGN